MHRHSRWDELRRDRLASPAASAGYERARRAFELGEAGRVAPSLDTLDRAAAALGVELVITFQQPPRGDRRQLSG